VYEYITVYSILQYSEPPCGWIESPGGREYRKYG